MSDHDYLYYETLKDNDVVLILGATGGDFIKEHKNEILSKNVFVLNVEPTIEGVVELSLWIKQNMPENAAVLSCAVSDKPSLLDMDIRENLITSTLSNRPETNQRWSMPLLYKTKVPVLTLDTIIDVLGGKVDKIFCDIEGSELEAFKESKKCRNVPYIAIAAYHLRDGKETHEIMIEWDWEGFALFVDGTPSFHKNEKIFFARKYD